jgi:hypothetical protein
MPPRPDGPYHLTEPLLDDSVIEDNALVEFRRCFPNLGMFHYSHGRSLTGTAPFLPRKVRDPIAHLECFLEDLYLMDD